MATVANSTRSLPNYPLGIERVHTAHDSAAVGSKLVDININRFILVEDTNVVVDAHHSEDKIKGQRQQ